MNISHFQGQLTALENLNFNTSTLPGIYNVEARAVAGTHQFTFIDDGTVNIIWADGNEEFANWSVNNIGQLILSGPTFSDILTLTSGNQSSGDLDIVVDDEDGIFNTPGTIKLATFDGSYNATVTSTTPFPCENASGVMSIDSSIIAGSISGVTTGGTGSISGYVQSDGSVLGTLAYSAYFTNITGLISGTSGSGTWSQELGCAGTWAVTKNLP